MVSAPSVAKQIIWVVDGAALKPAPDKARTNP